MSERVSDVLAAPPVVHRGGPDVRLPEVVTLRRGDADARAVIGPLTTSLPALRFVCTKIKGKPSLVTFAFIAVTFSLASNR